VKLFLLGGFLGSVKTTAIHHAVNYLQQAGKKAGIITNDQGTQQVDTQYMRFHNILSGEVSGSCFCCNLPGLDRNIHHLIETQQPDAIFAESVGSCTDLIATVVNPLLTAYQSQLEITLSVFADIRVLFSWLQGDKKIFNENVNYIYDKQLEEAEILVINKIDLLTEKELSTAKQLVEQSYSHKTILYQNSLNVGSISKWISIIFDHQNSHLRPSLQLDYDRYGAGEAEMAWLDEEIGILTEDKNSMKAAIMLVEKIHSKTVERGYPIGHLKFLLNDGRNQQKISYTSGEQGERVRVQFKPSKTDRAVILVNARVQTEPALLRKIVSDSIDEVEFSTGCRVIESKLSSFKPGYPKPSQRIPA